MRALGQCPSRAAHRGHEARRRRQPVSRTRGTLRGLLVGELVGGTLVFRGTAPGEPDQKLKATPAVTPCTQTSVPRKRGSGRAGPVGVSVGGGTLGTWYVMDAVVLTTRSS